MYKYQGKHVGCTGTECPHCPKLELPEYYEVLKHLILEKESLFPLKSPNKHACKFFGEDTGEKSLCPSCKGKVALKVYNCEIFGKCTLGKDGEIHGCLGNGTGCKSKVNKVVDVYELAKELNTYSNPKLQKEGWPSEEITKKAHHIALESFIMDLEEYPKEKYSGKGIVVVGGGKYWDSIWVTINMIRYVGCQLPIQVWYLGKYEENSQIQSLLRKMGIECIDALLLPKNYRTLSGFHDSQRNNIHPPFQLKSFAALHSPYEEVLVLDADNYPCTDPTTLFEDLSYKEMGGIFWPDLPHTNEWTKWDFFGVKKFGRECGLEVGQYVYNKSIAWKQLNIARWLDDHGDWCYGWGHYGDHGDKGPHRIAWAKLEKNYTMFSEKAVWKQPAFIHPGPDSKPMFVHRCKSKFVLDEGVIFSSTPQTKFNQKGGLPEEEMAFKFLEQLRGLL